MKHTHILLDMDGVLADFFTPALARCNNASLTTISATEYVESGFGFDMAKVFCITPKKFWQAIDWDAFWSNLVPFRHAGQLIDALYETGLPVYISSSPSQGRDCVPDKIEWLRRYLSVPMTACMFGSAKHLMARPGALLIDDYAKNCDAFIEAGGDAVCVPSNWNTLDLTFADVWAPISEKLNLP